MHLLLLLDRIAHTTYVATVTDRVAWSVGQSVTLVSPANTAVPMEMPFGLLFHVWLP